METTVENKEYFSTIIDAMTDLIRVVDEEGRILMINAAMQEVAGSCLGKQCFECLGESSPCPDCVREGVLQSGRIARAERTIRGRCYSLTAAPVKDGGGNTRAVVEVFRDISDMANLRNRASIMGSVTYSYKDRYSIAAALRGDGSSMVSDNNTFAHAELYSV